MEVVPAGQRVGMNAWIGEQFGQKGGARGVEEFVGVENQDPVALCLSEELVSGGCEVVVPGDGQDLCVEAACDVEGVIGGAGVAEEDSIDMRGHALKTACEG